jgi:hypothetical protein
MSIFFFLFFVFLLLTSGAWLYSLIRPGSPLIGYPPITSHLSLYFQIPSGTYATKILTDSPIFHHFSASKTKTLSVTLPYSDIFQSSLKAFQVVTTAVK